MDLFPNDLKTAEEGKIAALQGEIAVLKRKVESGNELQAIAVSVLKECFENDECVISAMEVDHQTGGFACDLNSATSNYERGYIDKTCGSCSFFGDPLCPNNAHDYDANTEACEEHSFVVIS